MKKLVILLSLIVLPAWVHGTDFDVKLKRFVTIADGKYAPEISCDEAVKLGFTVNDYMRFVQYVEQLNVRDTPALTLPENLFLASFLEFRGDTLVLAIPLEKALRAGATVEGYFQTLEVVRTNNDLWAKESKTEQARNRGYLAEYQRKLQEFARRHPDSCAVRIVFTPPKENKILKNTFFIPAPKKVE
ncbi:hypothetical protein [Rikenella microfusus]|uniref:hypothetical protein n=1 Tax=Rikenella microfusus TaxID=28139 RepID=UPI00248EDE5E|nr:hypothetical protein [Rikenella microfusus]